MNREIKFRVWRIVAKEMKEVTRISYGSPTVIQTHSGINAVNDVILMQSTGFKDIKGKEIYEGDILTDWILTDKGKVQSKQQVFWNDPTGSWHLDLSFKQNKTHSIELWTELSNFNYEIYGNIHEKI